MLFNSYRFAIFFAILFPLYWLTPAIVRLALRIAPQSLTSRLRGDAPLLAQNVLLLAAAYYFYGCWDPRFLSLLILSTLMDYACGFAVDRIDEPRKRMLFVMLSMALNLGMLGYFKYFNFFAESFQVLLTRAGLHVPLAHLNVILPIGISFYTFQSMSYVIDVYRREIKPTRNLIDFASFVSFFPHLVAGPIMRPATLLPQIERRRRFDLARLYRGAYLIFWGLMKKVVIADNLAKHVVEPLFNQWQTIDGGLALLAIYAFAFQIYCDFSGYTDAARGIAKCLGFELALNFNLPYFATSPKDFWARWHISLSTWLRDYLYIPLGGNRGGKLAVYRNLMLTMVIGGLWHGAAWTFVLWGFYHGLILSLHRLAEPWLKRVDPADPVERACWAATRMVVTFHLVCLGWLLFRASSLEQAWGMLTAIAMRPAIPVATMLVPVLVCVLPLLVVQVVQYVTKDLEVVFQMPWFVRSTWYTFLFYAFVLGGELGGSQFIYFQF
jgi:D-alanyl-lipoteichoic acid acyltransferase DltB (MBOAT superfamily)